MRLFGRVPFALAVFGSFGVMASCDRANESAVPVLRPQRQRAQRWWDASHKPANQVYSC
jgi:hypothetical protein